MIWHGTMSYGTYIWGDFEVKVTSRSTQVMSSQNKPKYNILTWRDLIWPSDDLDLKITPNIPYDIVPCQIIAYYNDKHE